MFANLTVRENVKVALQRPSGLAVQFWLPLSPLDRLDARADLLLEQLGLAQYRDHRAGDLSYGRKRVLEIATTLALVRGAVAGRTHGRHGAGVMQVVAGIIREVAHERAVLMVEHNLNVVADICDHVTVLQRGEIIARGDYATVSADPCVRSAYMGTDA